MKHLAVVQKWAAKGPLVANMGEARLAFDIRPDLVTILANITQENGTPATLEVTLSRALFERALGNKVPPWFDGATSVYRSGMGLYGCTEGFKQEIGSDTTVWDKCTQYVAKGGKGPHALLFVGMNADLSIEVVIGIPQDCVRELGNACSIRSKPVLKLEDVEALLAGRKLPREPRAGRKKENFSCSRTAEDSAAEDSDA